MLASIVASARKSDYLVMYLPDGDRLRQHGYYIVPSNEKREDKYDLEMLSQETCAAFLQSHEKDLGDMEADESTIDKYFGRENLANFPEYEGGSLKLVDLLKHSQKVLENAPMCFCIVVEALRNQDEKPFLMVMDDFNCYYDKGFYYHMKYDDDVKKPIPYSIMNLFEHAMATMALTTDLEDENVPAPTMIKRGGLIAGFTESHCVRRKVTDALVTYAKSQEKTDESLMVVEVPRFSSLEADHVLANFETIGVGAMRFDQGETQMNKPEMAYLKMVSGSIGQKLLDVAVMG